MKATKIAAGVFLAAGALLGLALFLRSNGAPEPAGPSRQDLYRAIRGEEEAGNRQAPPSFAPTNKPEVPVRTEGDSILVGNVVVDLRKPREEVRRLIDLLRLVISTYRKEGKEPPPHLPFEVYKSLAELIKASPDAGEAFFDALQKEPDGAIRDALIRLTKLSPSPKLHADLIAILNGGGTPLQLEVATMAMENKKDPTSNLGLLSLWSRSEDPGLRHKAVEVLVGNMDANMPTPLKNDVLEGARKAASESPDARRRVEAATLVIKGQDGRLSLRDREWVKDLIGKEQDPEAKRRLMRLESQIQSRFRSSKSNP